MTKIEALEKTIYNLENDVYCYNWSMLDTCNCGILAKTVLGGKSPMENGLFNIKPIPLMPDTYHLFSDHTHCLNTGIELPKVFQSLEDCGFTHDEMRHLEFLNDSKILPRIHDFDMRNDSAQSLLKYLRAWVEILKEEKTVQAKTERVKTIYVSVPETIKEQTGELILS